MKKKLISVILAATSVFALAAPAFAASVSDVNETMWERTDNDVTISTYTELLDFAKDVNDGDDYAGRTVSLELDIPCDLSTNADYTWTPIGFDLSKPFKGTFDGKGHTISNLKSVSNGFVNESNGQVNGFFGTLSGATVKNVTFDNIKIENEGENSRGNFFGVVAGRSTGNVTISDVTVKDSAVSGYGKLGMFIGYATGANATVKMTNCFADTFTVTGACEMGGIIGRCDATPVFSNVHTNLSSFNESTASEGWVELDGYTDCEKGVTGCSGIPLYIRGEYLLRNDFGDNVNYAYPAYAEFYTKPTATSGHDCKLVQDDVTYAIADGSDKFDGAACTDNIHYHAELQGAITNCENGKAIDLRTSVETDAITVPEGKNVILELHGNNIMFRNNSQYNLVNKGTLTINDDGHIYREDCDYDGIYYLIANEGTMTINGGYYTYDTGSSDTWKGASLIRNTGTLTINDGEFEQDWFIVVKNEDESNLTINGGKFTTNCKNLVDGKEGYVDAVQNYGTATINGGEFNGPVRTGAWNNKYQSETIVNGGNFYNEFRTFVVKNDPEVTVRAKVTINGGDFCHDVSEWVASDKVIWKITDWEYRIYNKELQSVDSDAITVTDESSVKTALSESGADVNNEAGIHADTFTLQLTPANPGAVRIEYTFSKGDETQTDYFDIATSNIEGKDVANVTFGVMFYNVPNGITISKPSIYFLTYTNSSEEE